MTRTFPLPIMLPMFAPATRTFAPFFSMTYLGCVFQSVIKRQLRKALMVQVMVGSFSFLSIITHLPQLINLPMILFLFAFAQRQRFTRATHLFNFDLSFWLWTVSGRACTTKSFPVSPSYTWHVSLHKKEVKTIKRGKRADKKHPKSRRTFAHSMSMGV